MWMLVYHIAPMYTLRQTKNPLLQLVCTSGFNGDLGSVGSTLVCFSVSLTCMTNNLMWHLTSKSTPWNSGHLITMMFIRHHHPLSMERCSESCEGESVTAFDVVCPTYFISRSPVSVWQYLLSSNRPLKAFPLPLLGGSRVSALRRLLQMIGDGVPSFPIPGSNSK